MGSDARHAGGPTLGVDGLPLGVAAALAVGGEVVAIYELTDDDGRALDLEARVDRALVTAVEVARLRLVCIDDGSIGDRLDRIAAGLAASGVGFEVVDVVETNGDAAPITDAQRSLDRARFAATGH